MSSAMRSRIAFVFACSSSSSRGGDEANSGEQRRKGQACGVTECGVMWHTRCHTLIHTDTHTRDGNKTKQNKTKAVSNLVNPGSLTQFCKLSLNNL